MFEVRSTIVHSVGKSDSFTATVDSKDGAILVEQALHSAYGRNGHAVVITEVFELSPTSDKDDGASCVLEVG